MTKKILRIRADDLSVQKCLGFRHCSGGLRGFNRFMSYRKIDVMFEIDVLRRFEFGQTILICTK